jgi:hypothetical protein
MNKPIRLIMVFAALAFLVAMVGPKTIFAAPPEPIDVPGDPSTHSGPYELGWCVSGSVKDLADGYLLNVGLLEEWNSYPLDGLPGVPDFYWALPGGAGDIFSCVATLKVMDNGTMVKSFPGDKGSAEVCLDTPSGKEGWIYFLDVFKLSSENPVWVEVGGPFAGGSRGCVPVANSGVYAYFSPTFVVPVTGLEPVTIMTIQTEGTVDVPAYTTIMAEVGGMELGGCVTGNIEDLAPDQGYRVEASVTSTEGNPLPEDVGKFYECVVDIKLYQGDTLLTELPKDDGNITICFAVPPDKNGSVYYLDKYFKDDAKWDSIGGAFDTGIACSPITKSGVYGMVDVQ